jgi:hypothetical protein
MQQFYTQPNVPNVADYQIHLQNEVQIPATALQYALGSPPAPALTASTSGGTLPTGNVSAQVTWLTQYGESLPSASSTIAVTGPTGSVSIASPPAAIEATGWNVYANEELQNATPIAIGTNYDLVTIVSGASVPLADTSASPWLGFAFNRAMALTLRVPTVQANDYVYVVYACATHVQLEITPDQPGQSFFSSKQGNGPGGFGLGTPTAGIVASASDQGTSTTFTVPEAMKRLSFQDLQFSKTPWGRTWLGWGQDFGSPVGVS